MNSVSPVGTGALCSTEYEEAGLSPLYLSEDFVVRGHCSSKQRHLSTSAVCLVQDTLACCHQSRILEGGIQQS